MKLSTARKFNASAAQLWPLLFQSKMDDRQPCYLLCGLPKPLECRLADHHGGVGSTRECVSDKGIIKQQILVWEPNRKLQFEMQETNIYFGPCVDSITETFEIKPINETQAYISRHTEFKVKAPLKPLLSIPMYIGLKSIHHYVFRNWARICNTTL